MSTVKQRRMQANYLSITSVYECLGVGFSELSESPSAQTTDKQYINDKSKTTTITSYEWSSSFTTDQIKSEKAIKYIVDIGELMKTGADAETDYVIVDLDRPSATANEYHARKIRIAIEVDDFDNNDGELQASGKFLGQGDMVEGTFNTTTKTFTAGWTEPTTTTTTA